MRSGQSDSHDCGAIQLRTKYNTSTLQHYSNTTALRTEYNTTTLQLHFTPKTTLQGYNTPTLQHYNTIILKHYSTTTLQHYVQQPLNYSAELEEWNMCWGLMLALLVQLALATSTTRAQHNNVSWKYVNLLSEIVRNKNELLFYWLLIKKPKQTLPLVHTKQIWSKCQMWCFFIESWFCARK